MVRTCNHARAVHDSQSFAGTLYFVSVLLVDSLGCTLTRSCSALLLLNVVVLVLDVIPNASNKAGLSDVMQINEAYVLHFLLTREY